ncbi:MAG: YraN family protein [Treponema sp.]
MTDLKIGPAGEAFAKNWLERQGYVIVAQNWRTKTGEIDLIAEHTDRLIFFEVKTLPHTSLADLDIIVGRRKQERICKTAKYFLITHRKYNKMHIRFDVLVLPFDPRTVKDAEPIHLKNAFEDYV